jgi:hypothetical protein
LLNERRRAAFETMSDYAAGAAYPTYETDVGQTHWHPHPRTGCRGGTCVALWHPKRPYKNHGQLHLPRLDTTVSAQPWPFAMTHKYFLLYLKFSFLSEK